MKNNKLRKNVPGRFKLLSDEQIDSLAADSTNDNTNRSTSTWMNVYDSWRAARQITKGITDMDAIELDGTLQRFYAEVVKQNQEDYKPDSLAVIQAALQWYLRENGCLFNIVSDQVFHKSNAVLEGKARRLRMEGKGKRPNATRALTQAEEEFLYSSGRMGSHRPSHLSTLCGTMCRSILVPAQGKNTIRCTWKISFSSTMQSKAAMWSFAKG